jgi:hypothetical protein
VTGQNLRAGEHLPFEMGVFTMASNTIRALFDDPAGSRKRLIEAIGGYQQPEPDCGSSFFIHLSELCPVACKHCMYSSDLNPKSLKDSLGKDDLGVAIDLINDSRSEKLNITGGGEPFLKFAHILRLIEMADVPTIEIVTAGYWAKTQQRAESVLAQLEQARRRNPHVQELRLRLSLDRYHLEAPRPVTLSCYANVAKAWSTAPAEINLGYRSIQPDQGHVDLRLAAELGARVEPVDDWNHRIVLANGRTIPITFNVMRFSGNATDLEEEADLRSHTKAIKEYYKPFETAPGRLSLAVAVNDAINRTYKTTGGAALTLNSDGTFWVFCGTAPDRKLKLGAANFKAAMQHFFSDPITRFLTDHGVWALGSLVESLNPEIYAQAIKKNDMAFLVEDLLASDEVRLAITLSIMGQMLDRGELWINERFHLPELSLVSAPEILAISREAIAM